MRRISLVLLSLMGCGAADGQYLIPEEVQRVIDRSHTTRVDYAVSLTSEVVRNGSRHTEIGSEFQLGALHRVEAFNARVLANCDTGEETLYDVTKAAYVDRPEWRAGACGIAVHADEVISARLLPQITGPFGKADVVELVGKKFVRTYAVTVDGIIVRTDYIPRSADVPFELKTISTTLKRGAPDRQMFDPESLTRRFGPVPPE